MEFLNAYIDESVHDDHGLYVIAAVLMSPGNGAHAASALRGALPVDEVPHWHNESSATRQKLVATVGSLDLDARVYGCRFRTSRRAEAARARAIGWFLVDLDVPLAELVLDRRQRSQNLKDQRLLTSLLPAAGRTTYRHTAASTEPLLWVADIVVGAVCASWLRGTDYLDALRPVLSACECEPE